MNLWISPPIAVLHTPVLAQIKHFEGRTGGGSRRGVPGIFGPDPAFSWLFKLMRGVGEPHRAISYAQGGWRVLRQ